MSTDSNQPSRPPAPPPGEPEEDAATRPAARWGQEPPTQAVPAWQPPPPPPPPGPQQAQPRQAPPQQAPPQQAPPQPQQQQTQPQTQPRPWTEPQDDQPGRWPPQPAPQSQVPRQWGEPPQPPASQPPVSQPQPKQHPRLRRLRRKRRVRRSIMALFTVIVLLILLVIGDRVALAVTENQFASQIQSNGLPVKPSVSIEGFPFLTQLVAKDFHTVHISASNVPAGPVSITSVNATIDGLHFTSLSSSASARADRVDATAFVSFGALTAAGGIATGSQVTMTPAGPNTVKISANLGGVFSDSEEARITATGPQTISVKVLPSSGALGSLLSSFGSFSFSLPKGVPSTLRITRLDLNSQGLTVSASATNAAFGK